MFNRSKHSVLLIFLVSSAASFGSETLDFERWKGPVSTATDFLVEIPMELHACNPIVKIKIAGKEHRLFLDTGATSSPLYSSVLPSDNPRRKLSDRISVARASLIEVGDLKYKNVTVAAFDPSRKRWPEDIQGSLGSDFFETVNVTLNFREKKVVLRPSGAPDLYKADTELPILLREKPLVPEIEIKIEGVKGRMLLDTGNNGPIILSPEFAKAHSLSSHRTVSLTIQKLNFPQQAIKLDKDSEYVEKDQAGNFGCSLLQKIGHVTIDYRKRRLALRRLSQ